MQSDQAIRFVIKHITHKDNLLSIIIRREFKKEGIEFLTPGDFSQQLGYMKRGKNYVIMPHTHNAVVRDVRFTQEVLFIKSGKVRVDFYDEQQNYLESSILRDGDVVLLAYGGHGLEMLEDSEIIEVKQGPYAGEKDKNRFDPVAHDLIIIRD